MTDHNDQDSLDSALAPMDESSVEETRRKLIAKLAAGAFAVPALLACVSRASADISGI